MKPNKRQLYIIGAIDEDNYALFTREMSELESKGRGPIHIELSSGGGDTYVGLAYYSRIRNSPCDVVITCVGQAQSAASIILAAGDKRRMCKQAWFMVHDDVTKPEGTTAEIAASEFEQKEVIEMQWATILANHSNLDVKTWRAWSKRTTYLSATDCLDHDLIDEVFE